MSTTVTVVGRLGADPEMKFSASGTGIAKFRVVSSKRKKVGEEWTDTDVTWWSVTAFKELAEAAVETLAKGDAVIVVGTFKGREFEDRNGEKRRDYELVADAIGPNLARPRKNAARPSSGSWAAGSAPADDPWATSSPSEEIPF